MLDYCQLPVFLFIILLMGGVVQYNSSENHIVIKFFKYFSNDRQNIHSTIVLLGHSVNFFKSRCYISLFKDIWKFFSFTQKLKKLHMLAVKLSAFCFRIFTGKLLTWVAFLFPYNSFMTEAVII